MFPRSLFPLQNQLPKITTIAAFSILLFHSTNTEVSNKCMMDQSTYLQNQMREPGHLPVPAGSHWVICISALKEILSHSERSGGDLDRVRRFFTSLFRHFPIWKVKPDNCICPIETGRQVNSGGSQKTLPDQHLCQEYFHYNSCSHHHDRPDYRFLTTPVVWIFKEMDYNGKGFQEERKITLTGVETDWLTPKVNAAKTRKSSARC